MMNYELKELFQYHWLAFQDTNIMWFLVVFTVLTTALFSDTKKQVIPNTLIYWGFCLLMIVLWFSVPLSVLVSHFVSFGISTLIFLALFAGRFLGGGDVKLFMFLGLAFLPQYLVTLWLWIFMAGGVQATWNVVQQKKQPLPYAVAVFWGTTGYFVASYLGN